MKKGLFITLILVIFILFSINFILAYCYGEVSCEQYSSTNQTYCSEYLGCTWDGNGVCLGEPNCNLYNGDQVGCIEIAGPPCEWVYCYGEGADCALFSEAECDPIIGCSYTCCEGQIDCTMYPDPLSECPTDLGCTWNAGGYCEGGEISDTGGLTCEDLDYQWMCNYYYPECTWVGEGCAGSFSCEEKFEDNESGCIDTSGCSWTCTCEESRWYKDWDGDGYSDGTYLDNCNRPAHYFLNSELNMSAEDCNDFNPNVNPGADEICGNGLDDDCDGFIDCANIYWADENGIPIDTGQTRSYVVGDKLRLVALDLTPLTEFSFEIYEDDSPYAPAEILVGDGALINTTDENGVTFVEWTITTSDIQIGEERGDDERGVSPFEFYFTVNGLESEQLSAIISEFPEDQCSGVITCLDCGIDNCGACEVECVGDKVCYCEWNATLNKCQAKWDGIVDIEGEDVVSGTCIMDEDVTLDTDGCDDGWLRYGWTGTWIWDINNPTHEDDGDEAYCIAGGINQVACPAQIELPFFGTWGIIVTIALIVLIYVGLNMKKLKKKK